MAADEVEGFAIQPSIAQKEEVTNICRSGVGMF